MAEFFTRIKCHKCEVPVEYWAEVSLYTDTSADHGYLTRLDARMVLSVPPEWAQHAHGENEFCCPTCLSTVDKYELFYSYNIDKPKKKRKK